MKAVLSGWREVVVVVVVTATGRGNHCFTIHVMQTYTASACHSLVTQINDILNGMNGQIMLTENFHFPSLEKPLLLVSGHFKTLCF